MDNIVVSLDFESDTKQETFKRELLELCRRFDVECEIEDVEDYGNEYGLGCA